MKQSTDNIMLAFSTEFYSNILSSGTIDDFADYPEDEVPNTTSPEERKTARARAWLREALEHDTAIDSTDMQDLSDALAREATAEDKASLHARLQAFLNQDARAAYSDKHKS